LTAGRPGCILNCAQNGELPLSSAAVRVSLTSQAILRDLAARSGRTMQAVLEDAVEAYRRECFLAEANQAYAALRRDPTKWKAELNERAAWDAALSDGLEDG